MPVLPGLDADPVYPANAGTSLDPTEASSSAFNFLPAILQQHDQNEPPGDPSLMSKKPSHRSTYSSASIASPPIPGANAPPPITSMNAKPTHRSTYSSTSIASPPIPRASTKTFATPDATTPSTEKTASSPYATSTPEGSSHRWPLVARGNGGAVAIGDTEVRRCRRRPLFLFPTKGIGLFL